MGSALAFLGGAGRIARKHPGAILAGVLAVACAVLWMRGERQQRLRAEAEQQRLLCQQSLGALANQVKRWENAAEEQRAKVARVAERAAETRTKTRVVVREVMATDVSADCDRAARWALEEVGRAW